MAAKVSMPHVGTNMTEILEVFHPAINISFNTTSTNPRKQLQQAIHTTQFELNYERSVRIVEGVTKDEEIRKLRLRIHIIEDEVEELNEQLAKEEERSDGLIQDLEEAILRSDELDEENQGLSNELRVKSRELENAKVSCWFLTSSSACY
jgi:hypothetical protein